MDLYDNWPIEFEAPFANNERSLMPADLDDRPRQTTAGRPPRSFPSAYAWVRGAVRDVTIQAFELDAPAAADAAAQSIAADAAAQPGAATVADDGTGWRGASYASAARAGPFNACAARLARSLGMRVFEVIVELKFCPADVDIATDAHRVASKQDAFLVGRGITADTRGAGFRDAPRRYGPDDVLLPWVQMISLTGTDPSVANVTGSYTSRCRPGRSQHARRRRPTLCRVDPCRPIRRSSERRHRR
jgi:hypothetical protein